MRTRIGMLGVLALAAGCARSATVTGLEEGAPCLEDGDCADGMQCLDGACRVVTDCSSSADCAADQSCQGGYCVANDSCTVAADCPPDQTCVDGQCTRMGACSGDATCPPEAHCEDGACVQNAACTDDADCPADQTCGDQGVCERNPTCDDDADCPLTQSCVDGSCQRNDTCQGDADCPEDQHCGDAGVCERNDPCVGNSDCPIDQHCQDDTCERTGTCTDNDDCPLDQACVDHVCLRHAGCRADVDCDNQLWCDGQDVCDIALGCVIEDVPVVNDFVSCTVDTCDEASDQVRHEADHAACDDSEACTDDSCSTTLGCQNVANDQNLVPQVDGDCRTAVCSGGHTVQSPNDGDLPADDGIACTVARCQAGNVQMQYNHTTCEDYKPCTRDECTAAGCVNPADNTLVPPQTPGQYCQKQVCSSGDVQTVQDTADTAPDSNINDCVNPACNGIVPSTVPDDFEIPVVGTPPDTCKKWVCTGGSPAQSFDDSALAPADESGNCRKNICAQGVTPITDRSDAPADSDPNDCWKPQCNSSEPSIVENVADDHDHPTATDTANDCKQPACRGGNVVDIADAADLPLDADTHDCRAPACNGTTPGSVADDGQTPVDANLHDCQRPVCNSGTPGSVADNAQAAVDVDLHDCQQPSCSAGVPSSIADNNQEPATDGITCTVEECQNGSPVHREDSTLCTSNFCDGPPVCSIASGGCTTGTDPVCTPANATCFTSACSRTASSGAGACVDTAINGDSDATTKCGPNNLWDSGTAASDDDCDDGDGSRYTDAPEADNGVDDDCDGYVDEGKVSITCGARTQSPASPDVFDNVTITVPLVRDAGNHAPYQLAWDVVTEPAANSLALVGATTNQVQFRPVLYGDYLLRLTLTQPDAADQVCDHALNIPTPPYELNTVLIMSDAADVDLHLLGPDGTEDDWGWYWNAPGSPFWSWCPYGYNDWNFDGYCDPWGSWGGSAIQDCHWLGCSACRVVVPGQGACTASSVMPDWNPTAGYGPEDPTLDVDNMRGCYVDATGAAVCTPESVSVETPTRPPFGFYDPYTIAVHYFGGPVLDAAGNRGAAPANIHVHIKAYCEGVGAREFDSPALNVGDWWFVTDVRWGPTGCQGLSYAVTRDGWCGFGMTCP